MISFAIGCLVVGLLLLAIEIFLPGGILGAFGGILLLAASLLVGLELGIVAGLACAGLSLVVIYGFYRLEMVVVSKTRLGKALTLEGGITGSAVEAIPPELVGQAGVALAHLVPGGPVKVGTRTLEARSVSGMIQRGEAVVVERVADLVVEVRKAAASDR